MPAPISVKQFDHFTIVVKDLEATRHFYCDLLGMEEVERPNFSFAGKWFQLGSMMVHIILEHDRSGPAGMVTPIEQRNSRSQHFAFEIAGDPEALLENVKAHGVRIVSGPQTRPDGAFQLFIADPDEHIIELCTT
jgi:catechol 2,3-dioxygenase-like lactoylglutathione lyase family enzyme